MLFDLICVIGLMLIALCLVMTFVWVVFALFVLVICLFECFSLNLLGLFGLDWLTLLNSCMMGCDTLFVCVIGLIVSVRVGCDYLSFGLFRFEFVCLLLT